MHFSGVVRSLQHSKHYRLVVLGGGTGGSAVAAHFARLFPSAHKIAVIEPNTTHCYQPGLTLVAGGLMDPKKILRPEASILPRRVDWLREKANRLLPAKNSVELANGDSLSYEFLVIAVGLELRFDLIKGLEGDAGTQTLVEDPHIASMYSGVDGALKTRRLLREFQGPGDVLFTFPNAPIKCSGAPQKICYLGEELLRERGVLSPASSTKTRVHYLTALGAVYGVPKYARTLAQIVHERGIQLHTRRSLREVDPAQKVATFDVLDDQKQTPTGESEKFEYSLLHIAPPCSPQRLFREMASRGEDPHWKGLVDAAGWVAVHPKHLQNPVFGNVFALGDCANTPSPKTAAAITSQFGTLRQNLTLAMEGKPLDAEYDGYTSCPLVVDRRHVVLAEFTPEGPLETFPWDGARPSRIAFLLKRFVFPWLYWNGLVRGGWWTGPAPFWRFFQRLHRKEEGENEIRGEKEEELKRENGGGLFARFFKKI